MEWTGISKVTKEFKEIEDSKLISRWQTSVSSDRKRMEVSFQTFDGLWHKLFMATDEQAVMTLNKGG
jgi:hypothetical protein